MCFNISITKTVEEIGDFYGMAPAEIPPLPEYYNVSGFSHPEIPVLFTNSSGIKVIELMKWGLVPQWVKTVRDAKRITGKTLNARSETLHLLTSFRDSIRKKRCVVVVDGFFEPHHSGSNRYPFYIRRKERKIISIAGLYSEWRDPDSMQEQRTFAIITAEASGLLAEIHNSKKRMPVILPGDNDLIARWLDPELPQKELSPFFGPYMADDLEAFPVSKIVYKREGSNTPLSQHPARYSELEMWNSGT